MALVIVSRAQRPGRRGWQPGVSGRGGSRPLSQRFPLGPRPEGFSPAQTPGTALPAPWPGPRRLLRPQGTRRGAICRRGRRGVGSRARAGLGHRSVWDAGSRPVEAPRAFSPTPVSRHQDTGHPASEGKPGLTAECSTLSFTLIEV